MHVSCLFEIVLLRSDDTHHVRILVVGAGAMGSFFGGLLSARHDVTLIGRKEHVEAIRRYGLRITGKTSRIARPRTATRVPRGASPDLVLVATKAFDTAGATKEIAPIRSDPAVLSLQNGLDNGDVIAKSVRRVFVGTTSHGVTFLGPGEIRHAGVGETVIGPWTNVGDKDLVRLRAVLEDAGIPTRIASDVRTELWAKAVINASINPLAALAGVPNGRLLKDPRLARTFEAVCLEAARVAKAEGAAIDPADMMHRTVLVARRTATNRCSMLQDLDRGRRTEIDAITGAIVRAARRQDLSAPLNEALYALVRARERSGSV